jgi:hypothetical protein
MAKKAEKPAQYEQRHLEEGSFCNFHSFYEEIARWIPDGGTWVEIGVYWGESFRWGLVATLNEGKNVHHAAVDAFPWPHNGMEMVDVFHAHMGPELAGKYQTIKSGSAAAAANFADQSVDFVFIDADHVYDRVKEDILAWLPKVKPGGIIAGHDYNVGHPGVLQAVPEIFRDRFTAIPSDDFHPVDRPFYSWKVQL